MNCRSRSDPARSGGPRKRKGPRRLRKQKGPGDPAKSSGPQKHEGLRELRKHKGPRKQLGSAERSAESWKPIEPLVGG